MKIFTSTSKAYLPIFLAFIVITSANSQSRPMHEIHSMMIFNFIKYIQWPDHNDQSDFIIGVIGDDGVYNTLNTWYGGKLKGNKKFVIKKFASSDEVTACHILYIGKSNSSQFETIKSKVASSSTLMITDKPGLGAKGSGINFKTVNNKLAFELNQKAVEASKLKVSGQLANMAILI